MEPTSQGLAPETKHSILLLLAVKIIFMCPGAATCCQLLGVNERPGVHHFRQKCCWRRMGHRWDLPARILCSHGPPIHTRWAMGPQAPGCSVCRMQGLAIASPGPLASQERGGRHGGREEAGQKLRGRVWEMRNQRELVPKSFLITPSSPQHCFFPPPVSGEAGRLSPCSEGAWGMSSLNMCCLALQKTSNFLIVQII